jgi:16S rRNA (cytidine1402-2'-O)-methyltransferase
MVARDKSGTELNAAAQVAVDGGALYVVATPIGNLQDLSRRALDVLDSVDLILAEDTRHSAKLLTHYGITTACRSFHEHNESHRVAGIVKRIAAGERVALICDAGTPLISDPGFRLVAALREQEQAVIPIPGASAVICALSVAGLPTARFCFEGFLPARSSARRRHLHTLSAEPRTLVFYESPRRIKQALADLAAEFGRDRYAALARELTKIHESVVTGTLTELLEWLQEHGEQCRGEFVIVVAGATLTQEDNDTASVSSKDLLRLLVELLPVKQAVSVTARITGGKRNALYQQAVALSGAGEEDTADGGQ